MKTFLMFMLCVGWWPLFCLWLLREHNRALREVFGDESSSGSGSAGAQS